MSKREVRLELLLGRRVFTPNGRAVGRVEEVRAHLERGECLVDEYLVGSYALAERLAAFSIGRAILRTFGAKEGRGYRVPWDKMDLSDPARPRLRCVVGELETLAGEK